MEISDQLSNKAKLKNFYVMAFSHKMCFESIYVEKIPPQIISITYTHNLPLKFRNPREH